MIDFSCLLVKTDTFCACDAGRKFRFLYFHCPCLGFNLGCIVVGTYPNSLLTLIFHNTGDFSHWLIAPYSSISNGGNAYDGLPRPVLKSSASSSPCMLLLLMLISMMIMLMVITTFFAAVATRHWCCPLLLPLLTVIFSSPESVVLLHTINV